MPRQTNYLGAFAKFEIKRNQVFFFSFGLMSGCKVDWGSSSGRGGIFFLYYLGTKEKKERI